MRGLEKEGGTMNQQDLVNKVAYLEFVNDQLMTELKYLDDLLRKVGFQHGIETVKKAAIEVLHEEEAYPEFYLDMYDDE